MNKYLKTEGFNWLKMIVVLVIVAVASAAVLISLGGLAKLLVVHELLIIIKYNTVFWATIAFACGFAAYNKIRFPEKFIWSEVVIQLAGSAIIIFLSYCLFFYTSSNIDDREIWNGYVVRATYEEGWTEEYDCSYTTTDGEGHVTHHHRTCTRRVPPAWGIKASMGEKFWVSKDVYSNYLQRFNNEKKISNKHYAQVSKGDGRTFAVEYDGHPEKIVPAAIEHNFVNYLKGSQSIRKRQGSAKGYEKFVRPYPQVFNGNFGPVEINRAIIAGGDSEPEINEWARKAGIELNAVAAKLGQIKEVNPILYLVKSDQNFIHALEEAWVFGKKNDVVVVIGTNKFPNIDWCSVMSWTDAEEFKVSLSSKVQSLKDLTKVTETGHYQIISFIEQEISKPFERGGFKRKETKELEYLISDIKLPIWSQIVIFIISGALSWLISRYLANNEFTTNNY